MSKQWLISPHPIQLPLRNPKNAQITHVACGRAHTLVVTNEGIFSLGNNAHGQCGRSIVDLEDYENSSLIHRIAEMPDISVKQLVCGLDHSLVLTEEGTIYAFGSGTDGQLGNGSYDSSGTPVTVTGDVSEVKIMQMCSTGDINLGVSDSGDVFGWGNSEYGQLAPATSEIQLNVSKNLPLGITSGKIVKVACSATACAVLTSHGQVYTWGYGLLGLGPQKRQSTNPTLLPPPLFGANELSPDTKVVDIAAGLHYFAAITNRGELYTWGNNRYGVLGLGHDKDQYFPFKVSIAKDVHLISCGPEHVAAMCKATV